MKLSFYIGILGSLHAATGCGVRSPSYSDSRSSGTSVQVSNLRAFGRLYGVLRWFHPSDAAAVVDWDHLAIEGVRRVTDAPDAATLRTTLIELISPFAPTVRITVGDDQPGHPGGDENTATSGLEWVSWEHEGFGDSTLVSEYASKRRHRPRTVAVPAVPRAALWQSVDAVPIRGARVRLRGNIRVARHGRGRLWMRVDRGDQAGFLDTMSDRPIVSTDWKVAEIIGKVDPDATRVVFGTMMSGGGVVWFDQLELSLQDVNGSWNPVQMENLDFEAGNIFAGWKAGMGDSAETSLEGWNVALDTTSVSGGSQSLRIEPATTVITDELFPESPKPGEIADIDLGSGLHARVPISLASRGGHTIGDDPARVYPLQDSGPAPGSGGFDRSAAIADVIVVWNALEHFWPYWDVVQVDWNIELDRALTSALREVDMNDHLVTLRRLSAAAVDGHAWTTCPGTRPRETPPFLVDVLEGQVVVTASADKAVMRGDVVISAAGRPALQQLEEAESLNSGSPQWRRVLALNDFGAGLPGSSLAVRLRRGGQEIDASVVRGKYTLREFSRPAIEHLADDIYYIDLDRAEMADIKAMIDKLAGAHGVVFDLRGYPNSNHDVLSYLLTKTAEITAGMAIPQFIRPAYSRTSPPALKTAHDELPALQPHIRGRVAFLTGPTAISYAESVMTIVERYHLGAIVGSATAGTNGNIAEVSAPTGCRTKFTGVRVTKPDGSRFHLIGVQPTIPVARTLAGVGGGRDEVLEKALEYLRTSTN